MVYHFDICYHAAFRIDRHSFNVQIRLCGRAPYECESHHGSGDLFRRKLFYLPVYRSLDFENRAETDIKKREESIRRHVRSLGGRGNMARFIFSGIAGMIEQYVFHVGSGSENTKAILNIIKAMPLMIIVSSIVGPILEEIIFRKIIFGVLYEKTNFFIAGLISSVIFGIVHQDLTHLLLYTAMGFTFAFLYVQTKRIIVPIFAHVMMNTIVVVMQLGPAQKYIEQHSEQMQLIIGGLFV